MKPPIDVCGTLNASQMLNRVGNHFVIETLYIRSRFRGADRMMLSTRSNN